MIKLVPRGVLAFLFLFCVYANAQETETRSEEEQASIDIIKVYELVLKEGYESAQIFETLAIENYKRKHYSEAKKWFEKWLAKEDNPKPIAYFYFAKTLEALEEFDEASNYHRLYEKKSSK